MDRNERVDDKSQCRMLRRKIMMRSFISKKINALQKNRNYFNNFKVKAINNLVPGKGEKNASPLKFNKALNIHENKNMQISPSKSFEWKIKASN